MNNGLIIREYTYTKCVKNCKIDNEPYTKCKTTSINPFILALNEDFKGANCVLNSKNDEKKCIEDCKRLFKKNY